MSFYAVEQALPVSTAANWPSRAASRNCLKRQPNHAADVVFLDLEDAVAPDDKAQARKNIIQAICDIDWATSPCPFAINGLDNHYMYRDVVDVLEQASDRLDLIMIPKVARLRMSMPSICSAHRSKPPRAARSVSASR